MTHNWLSKFNGVYTVIQVVHIKFVKVALTDYLALRSSRKMIKEQVAAAAGQEKGGK